MTPAQAGQVAAIRAHAEAHRKRGHATFSVAGVELLLKLLAEAQRKQRPPTRLERLVEKQNRKEP